MPVSEELQKVMACPKCKGELEFGKNDIKCPACRLKFKILEGDIPDMLLEDAEKY
ncbi:MAG: Trm112 family protein [Candidatus Aenigmatarchaeota archaeon]